MKSIGAAAVALLVGLHGICRAADVSPQKYICAYSTDLGGKFLSLSVVQNKATWILDGNTYFTGYINGRDLTLWSATTEIERDGRLGVLAFFHSYDGQRFSFIRVGPSLQIVTISGQCLPDTQALR